MFDKGHLMKDNFESKIRTVFINPEIKIKKFTSILPYFPTNESSFLYERHPPAHGLE